MGEDSACGFARESEEDGGAEGWEKACDVKARAQGSSDFEHEGGSHELRHEVKDETKPQSDHTKNPKDEPTEEERKNRVDSGDPQSVQEVTLQLNTLERS